MRNRLNDLYIQIKQAQEEIGFIRKTCAHTSTYIALYSWRVGALDVSHLCLDCDQYIRPATEKEAQEYNEKVSQKSESSI